MLKMIYKSNLVLVTIEVKKIREILTIFGKTLSFFDYLNYSNRI